MSRASSAHHALSWLNLASNRRTSGPRLVSSLSRMDSPSPINFRAAQAAAAYGGRPTLRAQTGQLGSHAGANAGSPSKSSGPAPLSTTAASTGVATRAADGSIVPPHARTAEAQPMRIGRHQDALSPSLAAMVAGQVDSPVSRGQGFEQPHPKPQARPHATPGSAHGAYAMYGRAADRIEVATSVTVGRTLDARG